jgi:hypothetical protein
MADKLVSTAVAATLLTASPGLVTGLRPSSTSRIHAELRVNTGGYLGDEPKHAYLMASSRSWQTDEPALDMTAAAILAGAALWSLGGHR